MDERLTNVITTLIIAYYNVGVQYEFLKSFVNSQFYFQQGLEISKKELPPSHILISKLQKCQREVQRKAQVFLD